MHSTTRRRAAAVVTALVAVVMAGCGQSAGTGGASTTTTVSTTTTLPQPVGVPGTRATGGQDFLGIALRVPVVRPRLESMTLPPAPTAPTGFGTELSSTQIAYRQFGSGPNLLLVMGQHGTMTWWDPQLLAALAGQYTVTIFDLPGVGYSEASPRRPTLDTYADLTAGLVAALGLETNGVTVAGWGLGGDIALDAELRHPGFAAELVFIETPAPGALDAVKLQPSAAFASVVATTVGLSQLMFTAAESDVRSGWLQRIGQVSPDDMTATAVIEEAAVAASLPGKLGLMHLLHSVSVPVHVLGGTADALVPSVNAVRIARSIPRAALLLLRNAGYASLVSNQTQLVKVLNGNVG